MTLVRDPLSGRLVAVAPGRAARPGAGAVPEEERCPFCAGNEEMTPPAALELGEPWRVRVVPNLYPALERQEVVVHVPDHRTSLGELSDAELADVAAAWAARRRAEPAGYLHALVNEGRGAGASRAHTHSQLVWIAEPPPELTRETGAVDLSLAIAERDGVVLAAAPAPRLAYELLVAPAQPAAGAFADGRLAAALALLRDAARALRGLQDGLSWNAWLHDGPHWHLELLPRTGIFAGLELGAGIYVATVTPEDAAARLRELVG